MAILPDDRRRYDGINVLELWQGFFYPLNQLPNPTTSDYLEAVTAYLDREVEILINDACFAASASFKIMDIDFLPLGE